MMIEPQPEPSPPRWFTAIALEYDGSPGFWVRDAGLLCLGFRQLGIDARMVTLGEPLEAKEEPMIRAHLAEWEDPAWWRQWNLDGVVLFAWALKQYEAVARAIKDAGIILVLKLDSDGIRTPRVWLRRALVCQYVSLKDGGRKFPLLQTLARSGLAWCFPRWHGKGTVEHLEHADLIAIEAPISKQRYSRFLEYAGAPHLIPKLRVLEHAVTEDLVYDPAIPKDCLILSVGRWDTRIKDPKLLIQTLASALQREPDYRARLIGPGDAVLKRLCAALPAEVRSRIEITGRVPHDQMLRHYQSARITINTSVSESFCIALGETLCCGGSVVGHAFVSSFHSFTSTASGTLSCNRSPSNFSDALLAEIDAWRMGRRDPAAISKIWTARLHVSANVRRILELAADAKPAPNHARVGTVAPQAVAPLRQSYG